MRWESIFTQSSNSSIGSPTSEFAEQQLQSLRIIPLNYGMPSPDLFDLEQIADAAHRAVVETGSSTLQYGGGPGKQRLTAWIIRHMQLQGIHAKESEVLMTNGSSQALELVCKCLLNPGDEVWVERPSYFGSLSILSLHAAQITSFDMDTDGLQVEQLSMELKRRKQTGQDFPKFIYVIPNFHNPTGYTLSANRRKQLSELAMEYQIPIIEDDAYGQLSFENNHLPAIKSLSSSHTIYMSTFSKIIAPGLRLGWIVADEAVLEKLKLVKTDGGTNSLSIEVASNYLSQIDFDHHIGKLRDTYRRKRDLMVCALKENASELRWTAPDGGFYIWVSLPESIDSNLLLQAALRQNVNFVPGTSFFSNVRDGSKYIRLCYSFCSDALIKMGIKRLAASVNQCMNEVMINER